MRSNRIQSRLVAGCLASGLVGVLLASCGGNAKKQIIAPPADAGAGGEAGQNTGGFGGAQGPHGEAGESAAGVTESGGEGGAWGAAGASGALGVAGEGGTAAEAGAGGEGGASCEPAATGRIAIAFDSLDAERVTNLQWLNSASVLSPNVIGQGGPAWCTDPQEFFGQSYGAPEGTLPLPVVGGNLATLVQCGPDATITSAAVSCNPVAPQMPVTTRYHFYTGTRASQMRVTRTVTFDANTPVYTNTVGLRPYVARVSLAGLSTVIYPNQAGTAVTSTASTSCGGDCFTPVGSNWSGKWFADVDPTTGLALIVLRDPEMTAPVQLTINYDSYSNANLSSFVVLQPALGWKAPVTETEYLCFADLTSWPQAARDAATLPAGCGP